MPTAWEIILVTSIFIKILVVTLNIFKYTKSLHRDYSCYKRVVANLIFEYKKIEHKSNL